MNIDLERCMLPGQKPGDWEPSTPIDMLPALRVRYPGCIDDSVLGVQIVDRGHAGRSDWHFLVTREYAGCSQTPVLLVTQDRGDGYDFSDWPADEYPGEMLATILQTDRLRALQDSLGVFKPAAFDMMRRIQDDAYEAQSAFLTSEHLRRVDFFQRVVEHLAEHVAGAVDLIQPTVQSLKAQESFGLRAERGESRWEEVGEEASSPSVLYERTKEDVRSIVLEKFAELPRPIQVALWVQSVAGREFHSAKDVLSWDPPSGAVDEMDLCDMDEVFDEATRQVMGLAAQDNWSSTSEPR